MAITIKKLMQTTPIYTLPVAQHEHLTTKEAAILIINTIVCYLKQSLAPKTLRVLFRGNSRKCLNHSIAQ